jgi:ATP-dependent RNA helicase RhlB
MSEEHEEHEEQKGQEGQEGQYVHVRAESPEFLTETRFDDLGIHEKILSGLKEAGFEKCTPIQAQVIPVSLSGKDIAGQAQTGTGKTISFLIPIFSRLLNDEDRKNRLSSALIVAPTRELALQIYEDAELIGKNTGLTFAQVVGGIDYKKQAEKLQEGPDIVICTPGRVIDYIKQRVFNTSGIKIVVVDEADRLFDLGFTQDMRFILKHLPKYDKRQTLLFSATLSHKVLALTYDYMNLPEFISVIPDSTTVENIEQVLYHVGSHEKFNLLLGVLQREEWSSILIFANTKAEVEFLEQKLKGNGFPAEGITGDLPQPKRLKLMERFKNGKTKILVATDVASRGIHVEDISHVINYDMPQDAENYTHRIGRTARAGKSGKAISFACETYVYFLEPIEKMLGKSIPVQWPENDWFVEDKVPNILSRRKRPRSDRPINERADRKPRPRPDRAGKSGEHLPEKKDDMQSTYLRNIGWSSEPGGVFGLAPEKRAAREDKDEHGSRKKKRKSRPRRKKKAAHPPVQQGETPSTEGSTENINL